MIVSFYIITFNNTSFHLARVSPVTDIPRHALLGSDEVDEADGDDDVDVGGVSDDDDEDLSMHFAYGFVTTYRKCH